MSSELESQITQVLHWLQPFKRMFHRSRLLSQNLMIKVSFIKLGFQVRKENPVPVISGYNLSVSWLIEESSPWNVWVSPFGLFVDLNINCKRFITHHFPICFILEPTSGCNWCLVGSVDLTRFYIPSCHHDAHQLSLHFCKDTFIKPPTQPPPPLWHQAREGPRTWSMNYVAVVYLGCINTYA